MAENSRSRVRIARQSRIGQQVQHTVPAILEYRRAVSAQRCGNTLGLVPQSLGARGELRGDGGVLLSAHTSTTRVKNFRSRVRIVQQPRMGQQFQHTVPAMIARRPAVSAQRCCDT